MNVTASIPALPPVFAKPPRHYPTAAAKCADLVVHCTGLGLAVIGGAVLLGFSAATGQAGVTVAVAVYALGLVTMLGASTAYNFAKAQHRPLMRRFDHAGIFLMIAASYTPFTTRMLHGPWAIAATLGIWLLAGLGMAGKLFLPGLGKKLWIVLYLALGWLAAAALAPFKLGGLSWPALILIGVGGALYSTGLIFYLNKQRLKFARAIWHGHVVAAAGAHWTAVLIGVVLTAHTGSAAG